MPAESSLRDRGGLQKLKNPRNKVRDGVSRVKPEILVGGSLDGSKTPQKTGGGGTKRIGDNMGKSRTMRVRPKNGSQPTGFMKCAQRLGEKQKTPAEFEKTKIVVKQTDSNG